MTKYCDYINIVGHLKEDLSLNPLCCLFRIKSMEYTSMTKSELIEEVAKKFADDSEIKIQKKDVEKAVNTIFDSMKEALVNNQRIEIKKIYSC